MAGANYMGGRRNAAKARTKDTNSRLQKNHFGKQRLAILAKGLGQAPNASSKALRSSSGSAAKPQHVPEISLAHASSTHQGSQKPKTLDAYQDSHCPHRVQDPPPNASSSKTRTATRGPASRYSNVLREVDMTEPSSFRAEITRLLAHPDFAGLTGHRMNQPRASSEYPSPGYTPEQSIFDDIEVERRRASSSTSVREPDVCCTPDIDQEDQGMLMGIPRSPSSDFNTMEFDEGIQCYTGTVPMDMNSTVPNYESPLPALDYDATPISTCGDALAITPDCNRLEQRFLGVDRAGDRHRPWASISAHSSSSQSTSPIPLKLVQSYRSSSPLAYMSAAPSVDVGRYGRPSFLERMVAKHPLISASIHSVSAPLCDLASSPSPTAPLRLDTVSDGKVAESAPNIVSRSSSLADGDGEYLVKTALLDALDGRLFENSDPWTTIKTRLSSSSQRSTVDSGSRTDDVFAELREVDNRCGVGFTASTRSLPPTPYSDRTDIYFSEPRTPLGLFHDNASSNKARSIIPTTPLSAWLTPLRMTEESSILSEKRLSTPSLHVDFAHTLIPLPTDVLQDNGGGCRRTPQEIASIPVFGSSSAEPSWQTQEHKVDSIINARLDLRSISRSSPHNACKETVADPNSDSTVLSEDASAGEMDTNVQQQQHELPSPVPKGLDCREGCVAGPLLFTDDLGDCDDA